MFRRSIYRLRRPRLRRLFLTILLSLIVTLLVVLWISTRSNLTGLSSESNVDDSTKCPPTSQQDQLDFNATGTLYPSGFNYSNSKLCPENGKNVKLIILVTSPPLYTHEENRISIRNTWRHFTSFTDCGRQLRQRVVLGFMMGHENMTKLYDKENNNKFTIKREIDIFGDIIIGNFVDTYGNLPLKSLSMLEWAVTYCNQAKYLLKADDDVWVNIPKILNFIESLEDNQPKIYGRIRNKTRPFRNTTSRYFMPCDEYPQEYYPDYVEGGAYLLPQATWQRLYLEGLRTKFFKLEDMFLTGIVAQKLDIQRVHVLNFLVRNNWRLHWSNLEINAQVATAFAAALENPPEELKHIWNAYKLSGCYDSSIKGLNCNKVLFADALFQPPEPALNPDLRLWLSVMAVMLALLVFLFIY